MKQIESEQIESEQTVSNIPEEIPIGKTLSVCMIVKNESKNIAYAIKNAWEFANEIIVVDTGSTDDTMEIAERLGARVFYHEWNNDFSEARNKSIQHATCDWIFWLDADDRINYESSEKICQLKDGPTDCFYGFTLKNINPVNLVFIGGNQCRQSRMFPRIPEIKFVNRIHEQATQSALTAGLKLVEMLDVIIEHLGYSNPETVTEKLKRNIKLMLINMGFPSNSEFVTFSISGYNCFYAPSAMTIWDNNEFIGACDPFDSGLPETTQFQNEKLFVRACDIIRSYDKLKKKNSMNVVDAIEDCLKRMQSSAELTQVVM